MMETPVAGQMFGHYRVLASIDAGAGVEMYHADDPDTGAQFLLRIVADVADGAGRKPPRALQHPNILSTVEAGDFDGCGFVALEYVAGHTLAVDMRKAISPPRQVLHAGTGIAKGLQHAHSQGVVHGDVRPVNVWMAKNGDVKLMLLESASAGSVVDYQSPEQTRGEAPDARSDMFSLGVVLYEMATGRRPFRAKTPEETIRLIQTAEPDMISRWSPVVPPDLASAIHRCLARNPEDRFESAAELVQTLTQCKLPLPRERRWIKWAPALFVGVLAVLGYFVLRPARVAPAGSLAVLAFEPAAGDRLSDLASDLASEMADAFSVRPGLRVVAQRSSFRFTSKAGTEKQA
ncbi:MAG: serine/threonine-protein kinase, partial [Bryobacteraceae bacterium]